MTDVPMMVEPAGDAAPPAATALAVPADAGSRPVLSMPPQPPGFPVFINCGVGTGRLGILAKHADNQLSVLCLCPSCNRPASDGNPGAAGVLMSMINWEEHCGCGSMKKWRVSFRLCDFEPAEAAEEKGRVWAGRWLDFHGVRLSKRLGVTLTSFAEVTGRGSSRDAERPDMNNVTCRGCVQRGALLACDLCPSSWCDPRSRPDALTDGLHEPLIDDPDKDPWRCNDCAREYGRAIARMPEASAMLEAYLVHTATHGRAQPLPGSDLPPANPVDVADADGTARVNGANGANAAATKLAARQGQGRIRSGGNGSGGAKRWAWDAGATDEQMVAAYSRKLMSERESLVARIARVLGTLKKHKAAWPFYEPVDASRWPDYYDKIASPMCLKAVLRKLESRLYRTPGEVAADVRLLGTNCAEYTPDPEHELNALARELLGVFDDRWGGQGVESRWGDLTAAGVTSLFGIIDREIVRAAGGWEHALATEGGAFLPSDSEGDDAAAQRAGGSDDPEYGLGGAAVRAPKRIARAPTGLGAVASLESLSAAARVQLAAAGAQTTLDAAWKMLPRPGPAPPLCWPNSLAAPSTAYAQAASAGAAAVRAQRAAPPLPLAERMAALSAAHRRECDLLATRLAAAEEREKAAAQAVVGASAAALAAGVDPSIMMVEGTMFPPPAPAAATGVSGATAQGTSVAASAATAAMRRAEAAVLIAARGRAAAAHDAAVLRERAAAIFGALAAEERAFYHEELCAAFTLVGGAPTGGEDVPEARAADAAIGRARTAAVGILKLTERRNQLVQELSSLDAALRVARATVEAAEAAAGVAARRAARAGTAALAAQREELAECEPEGQEHDALKASATVLQAAAKVGRADAESAAARVAALASVKAAADAAEAANDSSAAAARLSEARAVLAAEVQARPPVPSAARAVPML